MEKENNVNVTTPEVTTTETPAANAAEPKTYTQADIDALIASEADRRVSKAQSR